MSVHFGPASEAPPAGGDVLLNNVYDMDLMLAIFIQTLQKSFRQTERIASLFGTTVQNQNFHILYLFQD
jgi:hypothetical protein